MAKNCPTTPRRRSPSQLHLVVPNGVTRLSGEASLPAQLPTPSSEAILVPNPSASMSEIPSSELSKPRLESASDSEATGSDDQDSAAVATAETGVRRVSATWAGVISAALVLHFLTLFLSYAATVEMSDTQARYLNAAIPYSRITHFDADQRRLFLGHNNSQDQPHRLQVARLEEGQELAEFKLGPGVDWETVAPLGPAGLAGNDRYSRWMRWVSLLSDSERSGLAATLIGPFVRFDPTVAAVRIVRLPTELTTIEQDAKPVAYLARVTRRDGELHLVAVRPSAQTTFARTSQSVKQTSAAKDTPPDDQGEASTAQDKGSSATEDEAASEEAKEAGQ